MLKLAVKADVPIIAIQTDDPINISTVIGHIIGKKPLEVLKPNGGHVGKVFISSGKGLDYKTVYKDCLEKDNVLIIVNPDELDPCMYNAGFISCPKTLIRLYLKKVYTKDDVEDLVDALGGMSYKNVKELCQMVVAQYGGLSSKNIRKIRRSFFLLPLGLSDVSHDIFYYKPTQDVKTWLKTEAKLLVNSPMDILRPRGLLFNGPPGVGKTVAAQYIAREMGLPIYLLDVGMIMSKWVGESEKNMKVCLQMLEDLSPCIMLIDEAEKMFQANNADISTRLLGSLLWWLQSHTSSILTIMTTNHLDQLPPELYRPGRIDMVMEFVRLYKGEAISFVQDLVDKFKEVTKTPINAQELVNYVYGDISNKTHSEVVQAVFKEVKACYLLGKMVKK